MKESAPTTGRPGVALAAVAAACTLAVGVTVGTLVVLAGSGDPPAQVADAATAPVASLERAAEAAPAPIVDDAPQATSEAQAAEPRRGHHERDRHDRDDDDDDDDERDDDD